MRTQLLPISKLCASNFPFSRSSPSRIFSPKTRKLTIMASSFQLSHTITLPGQLGQPITVVAAPGVSNSDFRNAIDSLLFKQWLKNKQTETGLLASGSMSLKEVLIQGVDMFGSRVGFLKFKADVIDKETGKKVPGIVFARGPAVAVLILLDSDGETFAVLTEQVRVPVGKLILELPAGMLDDDKGDIAGTAIREGGCDEDLGLFLYRGSVDKEIITQLQGKETGLRDHGEFIKVHVVPYKNLWRITADAKVLMAVALYEMAKRDGLLPPLGD
ncbi:hypothetical protein RD792_009100 [Penstemon davidsonii]|uniref:Uncharacterized protein n=1 Tax=Penstemon davidsonii TaxID=160366 RepID=A0ABR0DB48_9LAMI|nr:hypothetical protein RD792_009100 [Penstemon davidsonii]